MPLSTLVVISLLLLLLLLLMLLLLLLVLRKALLDYDFYHYYNWLLPELPILREKENKLSEFWS